MPNPFIKLTPDRAMLPIYFRSPSGDLGCFHADCELPLTKGNVEECREAAVGALVYEYGLDTMYNKAVLVRIPGGKA